jgi:hypothetical protein
VGLLMAGAPDASSPGLVAYRAGVDGGSAEPRAGQVDAAGVHVARRDP